jgi:hypothetical protein
MNYYEKLVRKMDQSMKAHPHSAMAMDMSNFQIVAKGGNMKSLQSKLSVSKRGTPVVVFQKPSQETPWIL